MNCRINEYVYNNIFMISIRLFVATIYNVECLHYLTFVSTFIEVIGNLFHKVGTQKSI